MLFFQVFTSGLKKLYRLGWITLDIDQIIMLLFISKRQLALVPQSLMFLPLISNLSLIYSRITAQFPRTRQITYSIFLEQRL